MSEQLAVVTLEHDAGACGLDGEELTAELLRENLELISSNQKKRADVARLRKQVGRMFACMMTSICALIIVAAWSMT